MTTKIKLTNQFVSINDNYTVTHCANGFVIEVSGKDLKDDYISRKFVVISIDELKEVIQDLAEMPTS